MKRFLLWIISVALGVALLLAAVMGVSYAFTTQGGCPDAAAQFGGQELETNGFCWQVPLLGGKLDKVFASPATLTVQKLGTCRNCSNPQPCRRYSSTGRQCRPNSATDSRKPCHN